LRRRTLLGQIQACDSPREREEKCSKKGKQNLRRKSQKKAIPIAHKKEARRRIPATAKQKSAETAKKRKRGAKTTVGTTNANYKPRKQQEKTARENSWKLNKKQSEVRPEIEPTFCRGG
jgi:hypothetical protein